MSEIAQLREQLVRLTEQFEEKHLENVQRLTRIELGTSHLDGCLDDLKKKLFGNGQPGILQIMEKRIGVVEKFTWRAMGFLAAITFIINFILILKTGK